MSRVVPAALQTFKSSRVCDDAVYDILGIIAAVSIVRSLHNTILQRLAAAYVLRSC